MYGQGAEAGAPAGVASSPNVTLAPAVSQDSDNNSNGANSSLPVGFLAAQGGHPVQTITTPVVGTSVTDAPYRAVASRFDSFS